MSNQEKAPLLGGNNGGNNNNNNYYFLSNGETIDRGMVVEGMPAGADLSAFEPKKIGSFKENTTVDRGNNGGAGGSPYQNQQHQQQQATPQSGSGGGGFGFWNTIIGGSNSDPIHNPNPNLMIKQRKAPIKVEPKVFFANERTFMAWMHIAIILAGTSIAILAVGGSNENGENPNYKRLYGLITLPVSVAFIVYAMYQYVRRAYMIRMKHPGPYADYAGPTVLCIMLMLSIVCQFAIKLYSIAW